MGISYFRYSKYGSCMIIQHIAKVTSMTALILIAMAGDLTHAYIACIGFESLGRPVIYSFADYAILIWKNVRSLKLVMSVHIARTYCLRRIFIYRSIV